MMLVLFRSVLFLALFMQCGSMVFAHGESVSVELMNPSLRGKEEDSIRDLTLCFELVLKNQTEGDFFYNVSNRSHPIQWTKMKVVTSRGPFETLGGYGTIRYQQDEYFRNFVFLPKVKKHGNDLSVSRENEKIEGKLFGENWGGRESDVGFSRVSQLVSGEFHAWIEVKVYSVNEKKFHARDVEFILFLDRGDKGEFKIRMQEVKGGGRKKEHQDQ